MINVMYEDVIIVRGYDKIKKETKQNKTNTRIYPGSPTRLSWFTNSVSPILTPNEIILYLILLTIYFLLCILSLTKLTFLNGKAFSKLTRIFVMYIFMMIYLRCLQQALYSNYMAMRIWNRYKPLNVILFLNEVLLFFKLYFARERELLL